MFARPVHRVTRLRLLLRIVLAGFALTDTRTRGTVSFDNVGLFGQ